MKPRAAMQSRSVPQTLMYLQFGSTFPAFELPGEDGNWLKVDLEKHGAKFLPIAKQGEIFFEVAPFVASAAAAKQPAEGSKASLRDRVKSVGSSIGGPWWCR